MSVGYTPGGRIAATGGPDNTRYTYTPDGQIETADRALPFTGERTLTTYRYDQAGRLTHATTSLAGRATADAAYTWDGDGNRTGASSYADTNHALHRPTTGSTACNNNPDQGADKATDGDPHTKWCSSQPGDRVLQVDLGQARSINQFVVRHAGGGGEQWMFNTRDFDIDTSTDGVTWTNAVTARGVSNGVTTHPLTTPSTARYLRLKIITATQGYIDGIARIYEFEARTNTEPTNLAANQPTTAGPGTVCGDSTPDKATNANPTDKWCTTATDPAGRTLTVDLGTARTINTFRIRHADSNGEGWFFNTRDFDIDTSTDGTTWTTAVAVRGNTNAISTHPLTTNITARYIRLRVLEPTPVFWDHTTRIYEFEALSPLDPASYHTTSTAYDAADRPLTGADGETNTYDADGNLVSSGASRYTYNPFGELIGADTPAGAVGYRRDPLGRLTNRTTTAGTDVFGYAGTGTNLVTYRPAGGVTTDLIRYTSGELAATATAGSAMWAFTNTHGDLTTLAGANPTYQATYDAFGQATAGGTTPAPIGYQGRFTDPITGLVDLVARQYQPGTGMFTSADTVVGDPARTATLNRYGYANGDPINYTDPDGHFARWAGSTGFTQWITDKARKFEHALDQASGAAGQALTAIGSATASAASHGVSTAADWVKAHKQEIIAGAAGLVVGVAVTAGCEALSLGIGSVGCLALGFAAGGAVTGAMSCPEGVSKAKCAVIGGAAGAAAGLTFGAATAVGVGMFGASALSAGAGSVVGQYLNTGTVDPRQTVIDMVIGGVAGRLLGGRTPKPTGEPARVGIRSPDAVREPGGSAGRPGGRAPDDPVAVADEAVPGGGKGRAERAPEKCETPLHSFSADTRVRMADGSDKPISAVRDGDRVLATDPLTGGSGAQPVTATHRNQDTELTDVTVATGAGPHVIHTTRHHPFWSVSGRVWVDAGELRVGERLSTGSGDTVAVVAVRSFIGRQAMYDLTIANTHTYYVVAGDTPVLVHNCGEGNDHIVYRALAEGEDPSVGLFARDPSAVDVTPLSHVAGKKATPWISASKCRCVAADKYDSGHGYVAIDTRLVGRVEDISDGPFPMSRRHASYARRDQEVLLFQHVPAEAITGVWGRG